MREGNKQLTEPNTNAIRLLLRELKQKIPDSHQCET